MISRINLFFLLFAFFYHSSVGALETMPLQKLNRPIFGIIVPLEDESLWLKKNILQHKELIIDGIKYVTGKIANKNVVFIISGLGKVNSSAIATRLIRDFHPDAILLSGSSGNLNPDLKIGEVVIGKSVIDVDFGILTAKGMQFQYKQYLRDPQSNSLLPLEFNLDNHFTKSIKNIDTAKLPKIFFGKIATSDVLPNPISQIKLLRENKFDVIEMEGASVMQVCWLFHTPCIIVRGVSNCPEAPITQEDIKLGADNAAKVVINIISNYE